MRPIRVGPHKGYWEYALYKVPPGRTLNMTGQISMLPPQLGTGICAFIPIEFGGTRYLLVSGINNREEGFTQILQSIETLLNLTPERTEGPLEEVARMALFETAQSYLKLISSRRY